MGVQWNRLDLPLHKMDVVSDATFNSCTYTHVSKLTGSSWLIRLIFDSLRFPCEFNWLLAGVLDIHGFSLKLPKCIFMRFKCVCLNE